MGSEDGVLKDDEGDDELLGAHAAQLVCGELACGDVDKRAMPTCEKSRTFRLVRGGNHPGIEAEGNGDLDIALANLDRGMRRGAQPGRAKAGERGVVRGLLCIERADKAEG